MEALSTSSLPPGFQFCPTEVELISYYLRRKNLGLKIEFDMIPEVDVYSHEPWDLPAMCHIPTGCCRWHFFTPYNRKYVMVPCSKRSEVAGNWKQAGKSQNIHSNNCVMGTRKTLVFHEGRKRTKWIMLEYDLCENVCKTAPSKEIFVLCCVTKKYGLLKLDEDVLSTQMERNVNPCPLSFRKSFQEELSDVSVHLELKKEVPSTAENMADLEALITELHDPDLVVCLADKPKREQKVDLGCPALKYYLEKQRFPPILIEETDVFVWEEHSSSHKSDGTLFGQFTKGAAAICTTHQLEAKDAANCLSYPGDASGCKVVDVLTKFHTVAGLFDNNRKMTLDDGERRTTTSSPNSGPQSTVVDTGIPIAAGLLNNDGKMTPDDGQGRTATSTANSGPQSSVC